MPGADTRLQVRIDAKSFRHTPVLARIHFSAGPGEVLALLGPSGTGKTTALRLILGLDTQFSGSVHLPPGRIGTVFQEPRLLPWLDVAGNLRLVAPAISDDGIATCLTLAGLPGAEARAPKELSLGMSRRVAVARALAVQPALLVMDEPFASLDMRLANRIGRDITAHARSIGAITLIATHDLDLALCIADRVLVLGGENGAALVEDRRCVDTDAEIFRRRFPFLLAEKGSLLF